MIENLLIWLIDDDDIAKFVMKRNLKELNVQNIKDFSDSTEALQFLVSNFDKPEMLPDIIFLDLNMPIIDGFQFAESFEEVNKKITKTITIYMLSASAYPKHIERAKSISEIEDYLIKPVTFLHLKELLENASKA